MRCRPIVVAATSAALLVSVSVPASAATPTYPPGRVALVDAYAGSLAVAVAVADPGTSKPAVARLEIDEKVLASAEGALMADQFSLLRVDVDSLADEQVLTAVATLSDLIASLETSWVSDNSSMPAVVRDLFAVPCLITPKTVKLPCAALLR